MKANVITAHGAARDVFTIREMPDPVAGDNDLILKVLATSVNPLDCRIRTKATVPRQFPLILGFDVCGIVVDMGAHVTGFSIGDRVIGSPSPFRGGANAEYVAIDYRSCARAGTLSSELAAAIPLVGITAYEALFDRLRVAAGDMVVIHAGAGGVGHLAIQLARNAGCKIVTTASRTESLDYCRNVLGADDVLDYRNNNVAAAILDITNGEGARLILDTAGGATFSQCIDYAAYNAHICSILPVSVDEKEGYKMLLKNITLSYQFMGGPLQKPENNRQGVVLAKLVEMVETGALRPQVSQVFDFENLADAHEIIEGGHTMGKLIVRGPQID